MARVSYTELGTTLFRRLLGHNPKLLEVFVTMDNAVDKDLTLPPDLQEEVRQHLAYGNGCRY
jgi:hypothetical protein